jgi:hypothetical protein
VINLFVQVFVVFKENAFKENVFVIQDILDLNAIKKYVIFLVKMVVFVTMGHALVLRISPE